MNDTDIFVDKTVYLSGTGSQARSLVFGINEAITDKNLYGYLYGAFQYKTTSTNAYWKKCLNSTTDVTITTDEPIEFKGKLTPGNKFKLTTYTGSDTQQVAYYDVQFFTYHGWLKKISNIKGIPTNIKNIGELGVIPIFGLNKDGEWIEGPSNNKETFSVTTGQITPGKFLKYLTIKGEDGNTYKVGVYG